MALTNTTIITNTDPIGINKNISRAGFSLDIDGYKELAFIDITDQGDSLGERLINAAAVGQLDVTMSSDYTPGTFASWDQCDIDFDGNWDIKFNLPNLDYTPDIDDTLFRKANEFSLQVAQLNNNLIQLLMDLNCCGLSTEYNKTMVPFLRFFADNPDTKGCGEDPALQGQDCTWNNKNNFLTELLKIVKAITEVYTVVEPIFCLIKPIPGNPWLPVSFDWMRYIRPYIIKFEYFMDKIMSGALLDDYFIRPVRNLNRNIQHCAHGYSDGIVRLDDPNTILLAPESVPDQNIQEAKIQSQIKSLEQAQKNLNYNQESSAQLHDLNKISANLTEQYFELNPIKNNIDLLDKRKYTYNPGLAQKIELYSKRFSSTGICECIRSVLDLNFYVPYKKAYIKYIPISDEPTSKFNSLIEYTNEVAFNIEYGDIFNSKLSNLPKDFYSEQLKFSPDLITNANFLSNFLNFVDKDTPSSKYTSIETSALGDYISENNFTIDDLNISWVDNFIAYWKNNSSLETIMDTHFNLKSGVWNSTESGSPSIINAENKKIIDFITVIEENEAIENQKLQKYFLEDRNEFENTQKDIEVALTKLTQEVIQENLITQLFLDDKRKVIELLHEALTEHFTVYIPYDIKDDLFDSSMNSYIIDVLYFYSEYKGTDPVLDQAFDSIIQYNINRKKRFGSVSTKAFNKYLDQVSDDLTNLASINDDLNNIFNSINTDAQIIKIDDSSSELEDIISNYESLKDSITYTKLVKNVPNVSANSKIIKFPYKGKTATVYIIPKEILSTLKNTLVQNKIPENGGPTPFEKTLYKMLKMEKVKYELLSIIDDNVVYDFWLAEYPKLPCDCKIICEIIQMVVNYLMTFLNEMIKRIIVWLIDYLVPDWLKSLIRLILAKLRCILKAVYTEKRLKLIDDLYNSFLESIRGRIKLYPYDSCVLKALDEFKEKQDTNNLKDIIVDPNANIVPSYIHTLKIDFMTNGLVSHLLSDSNKDKIYLRVQKVPDSTWKKLYLTDSNNVNQIDLLPYVKNENKTGDFQVTIDKENIFISKLVFNELPGDTIYAVAETYKTQPKESIYSADIIAQAEVARLITQDSPLFSTLVLQDSVTLSYKTLLKIQDTNPNQLRINYRVPDGGKITKIILTTKTENSNTEEKTLTLFPEDLKNSLIQDNINFILVDISSIFQDQAYIKGTMYYEYLEKEETKVDTINMEQISKFSNTNNNGISITTPINEDDDIIISPPVKVLNYDISQDLSSASGSDPQKISKELSQDPVYQIQKGKTVLHYDCSLFGGNSGMLKDLLQSYSDIWTQ